MKRITIVLSLLLIIFSLTSCKNKEKNINYNYYQISFSLTHDVDFSSDYLIINSNSELTNAQEYFGCYRVNDIDVDFKNNKLIGFFTEYPNIIGEIKMNMIELNDSTLELSWDYSLSMMTACDYYLMFIEIPNNEINKIDTISYEKNNSNGASYGCIIRNYIEI